MNRRPRNRRPRRRLRTRLLVAMAAIAVGVLVISGAVTITLARRTAVNAAQDELEAKAPEIASRLEQLSGALVVRRANGRTGVGIGRLISDVLSISGGGLVTIRPDGTVTEGIVGLGGSRITSNDRSGLADSLQLPKGVAVEDLDGEALAAGQEQTGRREGIVFVAQPLNPSRLGTPVLVLTQKIRAEETDRARGFFLIGSALAFGLAVAVAFILARRLTRPLAAMDVTARAIAAGDLSARVD